ncbi:hypothetical protein THAOC_02621, partial [Thalassiosira oceanica]
LPMDEHVLAARSGVVVGVEEGDSVELSMRHETPLGYTMDGWTKGSVDVHLLDFDGQIVSVWTLLLKPESGIIRSVMRRRCGWSIRLFLCANSNSSMPLCLIVSTYTEARCPMRA